MDYAERMKHLSIDANFVLRWSGAWEYEYDPLQLHRDLVEMCDDLVARGDDLLDITSEPVTTRGLRGRDTHGHAVGPETIFVMDPYSIHQSLLSVMYGENQLVFPCGQFYPGCGPKLKAPMPSAASDHDGDIYARFRVFTGVDLHEALQVEAERDGQT
jgi:hypothetical protein